MAGTRFSLSEVREAFARGDMELLCTKRLLVEIAVFHPEGEDGLSPQCAVQLHFSPTDTMSENDPSYGYGGFLDGRFSLDDLTLAFGIGPDEEIWAVTDDPNGEHGGPKAITNLSQIRTVLPKATGE